MQNPQILILVLLFIPCLGFAQMKIKSNDGEFFSLGVRSTANTFRDAGENVTCFGGQIRMRKRLNTEWFAYYIINDIKGIAKRTDAHFGC